MQAAPIPSDETARLAALRALEVMDSGREPVFDRIVGLARDLSGADAAAITLVDHDRQWVKAVVGMEVAATPRDASSFCTHAVLQARTFWVEDARMDPRFRNNDYVVSGEIIFYAGAPLIDPSGHALGVLCLLSTRPRAFEPETARRLEQLAALVVDALQQRVVRRKAEQQVARSMIRHAPSWIVVLDRELRFVMVSEKMEAASGTREADLVGRPLYDIFPDMRATEPGLRRALAGDSLSGKRMPLFRRDGASAVCDWDLAPWRGPDGRIEGVRVMIFDVTELVRSREAAARSEERLKLALKVADTVVWELNFKTNRVESVGDDGRFFEGKLDYADFIEDLLSTIHPDDRARVDAHWRETVLKGLPFELEYRLTRAGGEDFWVLGSAQSFAGPDGQPERIIGALRDINQRKGRDLALERAREEAEAANRAKSEFLANMSHEIRTPLNGVLGVAGALGRTELGEQQRGMVKLIEGSAHHLEGLLSDVLDLARIESGKLELRAEPFSLNELIGSTAALFARQAQAKGIGFHFEQHAPLPGRCLGDPVRLRQVLNNLLSNAVKFTERGGVTLRVHGSATPDRQSLRVSVTDTGVGFDDEVRERLFQRFEQADGSITRRFGGTGLGLAICRSLVDAMGGRIEASATPGAGSTFTLTVEFEREAAEEGPPATAPTLRKSTLRGPTGVAEEDAAPSQPMRVLLAEDHPINRKVVELILSSARVDLTMVENGEQAVEAFFGRGPFDLVLMDMQMPVMDGLSATRAIRTREAQLGLRPTPIFALTANAMAEHLDATAEAGADGHVSKPVAAATLLGLVEQVRAAAAQPVPPLARTA